MNAKTIAYVIHLVIVAVSSVVMAHNDITVRTGSFWIMLFSIIGAYICGFIKGGGFN